ncbi:hypothetical protein Baya_7823 [Bagarius yarrelli]|uniref:Uncharacterized protein n=1 Tax=Bagarius yarrelli TaxID=175774 RepID=A0A556U2Y3_BAGYA|nr:hypothetical protein Baya_7823 [Bagarius yarrelli]
MRTQPALLSRVCAFFFSLEWQLEIFVPLLSKVARRDADEELLRRTAFIPFQARLLHPGVGQRSPAAIPS